MGTTVGAVTVVKLKESAGQENREQALERGPRGRLHTATALKHLPKKNKCAGEALPRACSGSKTYAAGC